MAKKKETEEFMEVGKKVVPGMRLRAICRGHEGPIGRIAWSPCGKYIASPCDDKTTRIWNVDNGTTVRTLRGPDVTPWMAAWSPEGNDIVTAGPNSNSFLIWKDDLIGMPANTQFNEYGCIVSLEWTSDSKAFLWSCDHTLNISRPKRSLFDHPLWDHDRDDHIFADSYVIATRSIGPHKHAWIDCEGNIGVCNTQSLRNEITATVSNANHQPWWNDAIIEHYFFWAEETGTSPFGEESLLVKELHRFTKRVDICMPTGTFAVGDQQSGKVFIYYVYSGQLLRTLEGHTGFNVSLNYSHDGHLLATLCDNHQLRIWDTSTWSLLATIQLQKAKESAPFGHAVSFSPDKKNDTLAVTGISDNAILIYDIDKQTLTNKSYTEHSITYTSAKIVFVGESNVGKSCLAMRLAEDRYPEDYELGTTHGMRFWSMEAEELHAAAKPPDGQRRDVVLWDFGGQDEYQLVHQMFLHDTSLALVLIDPTRGKTALDEARDWNKRLEKHLGNRQAVKLLIGAKVDRKSKLIDQNAINLLCKECGFSTFLDLSSKTGRNTKKLRKLISDALDWDEMAKTSRPELFQRIRDEIEHTRKRGEIAVLLEELVSQVDDSLAKIQKERWPYVDDESYAEVNESVNAVTSQLASQGSVVRTKLMSGEEVLLLQLPVIERYAGSLIIAARNNPRGVPVLEERLLGSTKAIRLPGMTKKERLSPSKERMVLECIVELMIQHGICFRHGGLLVFPTLFPSGTAKEETLPHSVSLFYDFTGAIDNIYASLVSKLMVSEEFGQGRLRAGCVEFESRKQGLCGVRQIKRKGGLAHMDLFFSEQTSPERRDLFTRFVEEHLRLNGVDIREHQAIKCQCGEEIPEDIVEENIAAGHSDVICSRCRRKNLIGVGVNRIRERNPETEARMVALRKNIDKKLAKDIESAKKAVAGEVHLIVSGEPIRILHLSDLHFTSRTNPNTKLNVLLQDIREADAEYGAIETVEYLVISGDMTDKGKDAGFEKAREFVEKLIAELGLSTQRCIFVPGNHDVQDRADAYQELEGIDGKPTLVRDPENFPKRFEQFSNCFFHPLIQKDYPLKYSEQGISYLFPDTGIQFLTLNSAWQIDENGRKKASIYEDAIAGVISKSEDERKRAIERGDMKKKQALLRIGVWHHAVAGPELMQNLGFMSQLQKAGMKLCLHGDVHEPRTELFGYRKPGIDVEIVGAGSFGSNAEGRPESTPKLYNLLEITVDENTKKHQSIRVHTRCQERDSEAWQGFHKWTNPNGSGRLAHFDINLT